MYVAVGAHVASIDIREQIGRYKRMIECRIEDRPFFGRTARDADFAQLTVPKFPSLVFEFVKFQTGRFSLKIGCRTRQINHRDTYPHLQLFGVSVGAYGQHKAFPFTRLHSRCIHPVNASPDFTNRAREFRTEIDRMVRCPAVRASPPFDGAVIDLSEGRTVDIVLNAVAEVDDDVLFSRIGIGIAMHARMGCSGQFRTHTGVFKIDAVIARRCLFAAVAETRAVARPGVGLGSRLQFDSAGTGHQQNIAQVSPSCSAKVGMREADDARVAAVVARTPVPALRIRIGRDLYQTERRGGTGEGVSVGIGSDKRVHVLCRVRLPARDEKSRCNNGQQKFFHRVQVDTTQIY